MLSCRLTLVRPSKAFAQTVSDWGFRDTQDAVIWEGRVAGPDRLRFLGMLSRYAAILKGIHLDEAQDA